MRGGQKVRKLRQTKRDQNANDVRIMAEIQIDVLIHWERDSVIVECGIDLSSRVSNNMVLHTGQYFLHVAYNKLDKPRKSGALYLPTPIARPTGEPKAVPAENAMSSAYS
jgi:hypothetical protein